MTITSERARAARRLGAWLRWMRASRGISQETLAHTADLSVSTYGHLERAFDCGRWANPSLDTFIRLIIALEATSQELDCLLNHPTYPDGHFNQTEANTTATHLRATIRPLPETTTAEDAHRTQPSH